MRLSLGMGMSLTQQGGRSLSPYQPRPAFPSGVVPITSFQSGHGFVKPSGAGTVTDDTSVFNQGTQSLKIVTDGIGSNTLVRKLSISPVVDFSASFLEMELRVDQWARLNSSTVGMSSDNDGATNGQVAFLSAVSAVADDGEFFKTFVSRRALSSQTATFSAINCIRTVQKDKAAGAVTVNLQSLRAIPEPANGRFIAAFDDGWKTTFSVAFPLMQAAGFKGIVYPIVDQIAIGSGGSQYMSTDDLTALQNAGWDIGCHSMTSAAHDSANGLLDLTDAQFRQMCIDMKRWNQSHGYNADHFAWPKGLFNRAKRLIAAEYFSSIRVFRSTLEVTDADIYPFADVTRLRQIAVTNGAVPSTAAAINAAVDSCIANKQTPIVTWHNISDSAGSSDAPVATFTSFVNNAVSKSHPGNKNLSQVFAGGVA